jgi:hypothetical protein
MTRTTRYNITEAEMQAMRNATPKQWAQGILETVTDLGFWKDLTVTMVTAFLEGAERGRRY